MPVSVLDKLFLPSPVIRKPINGRNGISQTICNVSFISPWSLKGNFTCRFYTGFIKKSYKIMFLLALRSLRHS